MINNRFAIVVLGLVAIFAAILNLVSYSPFFDGLLISSLILLCCVPMEE